MAQDEQEVDSAYDFIYVDNRRVAQFLSQFGKFGHLTGLTRVDGKNVSGGGGVNVGAAKIDKTTTTQENQTRQFDPQWLSPLNLLDELQRRDLIKKDIPNSRIGSFILSTGQILLLDLGLLKTSWDKPVIQKLIKAGMNDTTPAPALSRAERRALGNKGESGKNSEFDLLIALLSILPHALQMRLVNGECSLWCTLNEESLIGKSSDLLLKHGALLDGEWNILGVLDATPWDPNYKNDDGESAEDILAKVAETAVGQIAARLFHASRGIIGRPPMSYGITPILIFREVTTED
ncbi:hypothetical protein [Methylorubrum salsuginis]|uniref:Uncharacterized protein n=1 Tax=Methylorubrum salsuginis TaxID=414703 RepID=A0A1I4FIV2_9HYPH|nr:hypothetical protein [Methylorubrum salsuginis]SFL17852.1 hypothetical protein SAMN04488125_11065 [Methylorubrum salsuginis]